MKSEGAFPQGLAHKREFHKSTRFQKPGPKDTGWQPGHLQLSCCMLMTFYRLNVTLHVLGQCVDGILHPKHTGEPAWKPIDRIQSKPRDAIGK